MRRFFLWFALGLAATAAVPGAALAGASPRGQERAENALQRAQDLSRGLGVQTGRELTPALIELQRTKHDLGAPDRRQADALLARPTSSEAAPGHAYTVGEHAPRCGVHFCIHYVTSSVDAPSLTDADANGTPDYVDLMLNVFENEVFACENSS